MKILGIGGSGHNYSACLLIDGKIYSAVEEERLNRIKYSLLELNDLKLARCKAAKYCLDYGKTSLEDIDLIISNELNNSVYHFKYQDRIILINHHMAHACSTFYTSPFKEAAVLVADGRGSILGSKGYGYDSEAESVTFYYADNSIVREIKKISGKNLNDFVPYNSIGEFYAEITELIGFGFLEDGKTMGLAPYGTDKYVKEFYKFYDVDGQGNFIRDENHVLKMQNFISEILVRKDFQVIADIAYAVQFHVERIMIELCNYLYKITKSKNLCLAGGVAMNSVVNYKILKETPFENIYVFPASSDSGTSIGAALYGHHVLKMNKWEPSNTPFSPYLGKEYSTKLIQNTLKKYEGLLNITKPTNITRQAANLIAEGKIIGWFQGRSEIGPRALGNRSILADPRDPQMKNNINERIKHREFFRPFAPAVLEEKQKEYFDLQQPSYYMLLVPPVRENKNREIPSVTHVDGTARLQTVSRITNPVFYQLIQEFYRITGVPVLLNTSFNDNGEPMVESPEDAINGFLNMDLDALIIDAFLLTKK